MLCGIMLVGTLGARENRAKGEYVSLKGAKRFNVSYDMRNANPKQAALFLRLIHEGFNDASVQAITDTPGAVIVINGAAVRLFGDSGPLEAPHDLLQRVVCRLSPWAMGCNRLGGHFFECAAGA